MIEKNYIKIYNCDSKLISNLDEVCSFILVNILFRLQAKNKDYFSLGNFQNAYFKIHKIEKNKIITLKFSLDENDFLLLNVVTFTKVKNTNFAKNNYYILEGSKLVSITKKPEENCALYIPKNLSSKKSFVDFMHFEEDFLESKIGYLAKFLEDINENYLNFKLKKSSFNLYETILKKEKREKEFLELIKNNLTKDIQLFDKENILDNEYKSKLENEITSFFDGKIKAKFTDKLDKKFLAIIFLGKKEDYENDPYLDIKKTYKLSQIVYYENKDNLLNDKKTSIFLKTILKELAIKNEIINKKFYLSSKWESLKDYEFFIKKDALEDKYCKIIIKNEELKLEELNLFDGFKTKKIQELKKEKGDFELIAFKDEDYYFALCKSKEFVLSDVEKSYEIYKIFKAWEKEGKTLISKGKEKKVTKPRLRQIKQDELPSQDKEIKKYTTSGFEIHYYLQDNCLVYFSATNIENLNVSVARANIIRKVHFSSSNFDYLTYLSWLDEYFVRYKETTVLPFVTKYLREFIKLNS